MTGKRVPAAKSAPDEPLDRLLEEAGELIIDGRLVRAAAASEPEPTTGQPESEVNDA